MVFEGHERLMTGEITSIRNASAVFSWLERRQAGICISLLCRSDGGDIDEHTTELVTLKFFFFPFFSDILSCSNTIALW